MMNFDINEVLNTLGISELNKMQKSAIEAFEQDKDIVLLSPTGTGKTLAYLIPLMQSICFSIDEPQAVIMVPTRELSQQTDAVIKSMKTKIRSVCCYGGRPAMEENRIMKNVKPHIVISTPGRLVDHLSKRNIETGKLRTLVLDEFDKCLEFGFRNEMKEALTMMPLLEKRVLLSATYTDHIPDFVNLGNGWGDSTIKLDYTMEKDSVTDRIRFYTVSSPIKDKLETLKCLLSTLGSQQSIVFLNYRESVERVFNYLHKEGFYCEMFHGGLEQEKRDKALYKFANRTSNILVSTDLSSRGLDIPEIDNIIHYHIPLNEDAFVHRNGRTARWEANGNSYMILNEEESIPEYVEMQYKEYYIPKKLPKIKPSEWATIYIGKGKKDKLSKIDILGFLCKIGGLEKNDVGRIDVKEHYTFVAIKRTYISEVLNRIKGIKIKGVKTHFLEAK